jgi:hypothetical protein
MESLKDPLIAIKNFFYKKARQQEAKEPLNPTKAALFGLDYRISEVQRRLEDKRIKRSAF